MMFTSAEEPFRSQGLVCAARVFRPTGTELARPVVVMGHGFAGVRALRLYDYAEQFAAAGYIVVVFDYRGFGESDGTPRQVLDVAMQLQDWRAALQFARTLPDADPQRVVAWGTSFGGGHVITLAGQGEPLAAIIAQVPHVSGPAAVRAVGLRSAMRLAPLALRDQAASLLHRAPVYVEAIGLPGATAIMTSPDAVPGLHKQIAEAGLKAGDYPQHVAARIGLSIGRYSPIKHAAAVTCPALVQIAAQDAVTPRGVAEKAAARIANATVHVYDCGHFDPYVEPYFATTISDQLDFLTAHIPVTR
ncbi:MAG: alpha/beta hydrolase [Actinomycetota bacterium]|nr:alpha/beta hydrolase [Actinomycetota bacterium]